MVGYTSLIHENKQIESPTLDPGDEVENDALFQVACVHAEQGNQLRHQDQEWTRAKICIRSGRKCTAFASQLFRNANGYESKSERNCDKQQ
jgi:hypothetical protein